MMVLEEEIILFDLMQSNENFFICQTAVNKPMRARQLAG